MIYLILSALYESFLIPFALLSVPFGLMGSFVCEDDGTGEQYLFADRFDYVDRFAC